MSDKRLPRRRPASLLALAGAICTVCAAWLPQARAQVNSATLPAISAGARLAANCAACHGANGATEGIALPSLAGQGKGALLVALKAFKSGARQGTIMPQIARGYTDEQLALLAEFFAAQSPLPTAALQAPAAPPAAAQPRPGPQAPSRDAAVTLRPAVMRAAANAAALGRVSPAAMADSRYGAAP